MRSHRVGGAPSLDQTIGKVLIARCPAAAAYEHPRLGTRVAAPDKALDNGSVAHRLVLGVGRDFEVLKFDSYRSKLAREQREAAVAASLTPVLEADFEEAQQMAASAHRALAKIDRYAFDSDYGHAELAAVAHDPAGVWTRDIKKAHNVAARLQAGTVWVNTYNVYDTAAPFGGYKQSGFGREMGMHALEQYTQTKTVWVDLS